MINDRLTAKRYHLHMLDRSQEKLLTSTRKNVGIWLALAVAFGIHVIILLMPVSRQLPLPESSYESIELQLTTFEKQLAAEPAMIEDPDETETVPEPRIVAKEDDSPVEDRPEPLPEEDPPLLTPKPQLADLTKDQQSTEHTTNRQLTNVILSRQFITEKTITEKLFPDTLVNENTGFQAEYHHPVRQSMISMLDQPMQDLPFAYNPGLIYFAYDPGVKGDLQRFWAVITPEFGWRTKYGTEVRCKWVLVIVGCGWK
jgi:hypothetical protein